MRQTVRSAGMMTLFLLTLSNLTAEPVVRGFFVEKLPSKATTRQLGPGKGLVLAHVFNADDQALKAGKYEIGVEIDAAGKTARFALKPEATIAGGSLKTFRMAVPVSEQAKSDGYFRVFSKIDGKITWSDKQSFLQGIHKAGDNGITTLYTEAPPEPGSVKPPDEIQFEHEAKNKSKVASKSKQNNTSNKEKKTVKTAAKPEKTQKAKVPAKVAKAEKEKPVVPERNIDPSEFKKLRTIDEELIIYVIKDGDTLKSIAKKYYGVATKERAIADLNFIDNPNTVKVGEEIIVDVKPLGKSEKVKSAFKSSNISKLFAPEGKTTYTIRKGDTLGKIARRFFGKSSAAGKLMKANPGLNPRNLRIGDVLIIPDNRGDNA